MSLQFVDDIFKPKPDPDAEPDARDLDDVDTTRRAVFDNVMAAVTKKFPVENDR